LQLLAKRVIANIDAHNGSHQPSLGVDDNGNGHVLHSEGFAYVVVAVNESSKGCSSSLQPWMYEFRALHVLGNRNHLDAVSKLLIE